MNGNPRQRWNLSLQAAGRAGAGVRGIALAACAAALAFCASTSNAAVSISDLTTAEKSAILADPNNEIVATAALQIEVPWDINVGPGVVALDSPADPGDDPATVAWQRNNDHGFNLVYDGAGNFELTITPPSASPISVSVAPTTWFNQLLFTIRSNSPTTLDLSGNIDGTDFRDLQATPGVTDGLRFDFPSSTASDVAEFAISGVFTPSTGAPGFSNGNFSGEFTLVKNATVPEPGSAALILPALLLLLGRRPSRGTRSRALPLEN